MLFSTFRQEVADPDRFYGVLATDTAVQISRFATIPDAVIVDVGGGAGYFSQKFTELGAHCLLIEPEAVPLADEPIPHFDSALERHDWLCRPGRLMPGRTIAGDGMRLPLPDNFADISFSSNVLEHVPSPEALIRESWRITKPGGTIYLSYTLWWSLWGGHETSPWHFFGGHYAAKRFERKNGRPPANKFGTSLFGYRIAPMMKIIKTLPGAQIHAEPRYYPKWLRWLVHIPGLREATVWNFLVVIKKPL